MSRDRAVADNRAETMRLILEELLRPLVWLFCRIFFGIRFRGVENVPKSGACIITPNHVTYADPIWVTIPLRRSLYYMAWDRLFEIPLLGLVMGIFGAFPINQEAPDKSARREAAKLLSRGKALVIFPEGGRTRDGRLQPFKLGAFKLALLHGAPIVPVTLSGAFQIWPAHRLLPRPGKLTVTYHPPIRVEPAPGSISSAELKRLAADLARRATETIASALDSSGADG